MRQIEEDILISHYSDLYEDSLLEDGSNGPTTASLRVTSGPILPPLVDSGSNDIDNLSSRFSGSLSFNGSRLNPNAAEFVPRTTGYVGNASYDH